MKNRNLMTCAVVVLASLSASVAISGDGRIEINQVRALQGGITAGDAPFFPVSLNESGSYFLTSDLTVSSFTTAIRIGASNVTLDLGGHVVTGPVICTGEGSGLSCNTSAVNAAGIDFGSSGEYSSAIMIRNGTIRGFNRGVYGSVLMDGCIIEGLNLARNSDDGFRGAGAVEGGGSCILIDVTSDRNGGYGISLGPFSLLTRSIAVGNRSIGILMNQTGAVSVANTARLNGSGGIYANDGSVVAANAVSANESYGIGAANCSVVQGNSSSLNAQQQLTMTGPAGWVDNVLKVDPAIPTSTTVSGGTQMGPNICENSLCP